MSDQPYPYDSETEWIDCLPVQITTMSDQPYPYDDAEDQVREVVAGQREYDFQTFQQIAEWRAEVRQEKREYDEVTEEEGTLP